MMKFHHRAPTKRMIDFYALQSDSCMHNEDLNRLEQDQQVEENVARIDILHIQRDALFQRVLMPSIQLPQTGDAWFDREALLCKRAVTGKLGWMDHARTDKRHLPNQDIEQLGKLIQARFT